MQTSSSFSNGWLVEEMPPALASPVTAAKDASTRMELRDWLLLIPDYGGQPELLELFATAVRYVSSQLGSSTQRVLLLALGTKLHSRARDAFAHRIHRFSSVEDLVDALRAHFAGVGEEVELMELLSSIGQERGESVSAFASRVDRLATRICTIYEEDPDLVSRTMSKEAIWATALVSFRRGLRDAQLELAVASCEPKHLDQAVRVAILVDNEMRTRDKLIRRSESFYKKKNRR